jgi:hypothetical protein
MVRGTRDAMRHLWRRGQTTAQSYDFLRVAQLRSVTDPTV